MMTEDWTDSRIYNLVVSSPVGYRRNKKGERGEAVVEEDEKKVQSR